MKQNSVETYEKAFRADSSSRTQIFCWHKMFSEDVEMMEDESQSGRPVSTRSDIKHVKVLSRLFRQLDLASSDYDYC